jgi:hypothetical protein
MMKIHLLTGVVGVVLTLSPLGFAQQRHDNPAKVSARENEANGVRAAIAFERAKDRADAHQARLEARHPSVDYSNADRSMDNSSDGHRVPDTGPAPRRKDKLQE